MRIGRSITGPSPFSKCSPTSIGISGSRMSAKIIAASTFSRSTAVTVTSADKLGPLAHVEKVVLLANAPILGHVASRLSHQPDRSVRGRLAPARFHHRMIGERRSRAAFEIAARFGFGDATASIRSAFARLSIRIAGARAAASLTRWPSFECSGSKSTLSPYARICSEQTGPIEPIAIRAKPRLTLVADSFGLRELDHVGDLVRAGENRDVRRAMLRSRSSAARSGARSAGSVHR